jgi:hypothetical protein
MGLYVGQDGDFVDQIAALVAAAFGVGFSAQVTSVNE